MKLMRLLRVIVVLGAYGALAAALYKKAQAAGYLGGSSPDPTPSTAAPTSGPSPVTAPDPLGPVDSELIGV